MTNMQTSGGFKSGNFGGFGRQDYLATQEYYNRRLGTGAIIDNELAAGPSHQMDSRLEISALDADYLAEFIAGTAYYIEHLEEYIGEDLLDFWQSREHAYRIITNLLVMRLKRGERAFPRADA